MSNYAEGQVHQLMNTFEKAGYTAKDLTQLGQFPDHLLILGVLCGAYEVRAKDSHSRLVTVNRTLSPEQAIAAVDCFQSGVDGDIVKTMPRGDKDKDKDKVFFVKCNKPTSHEEWGKHLDSLGLKPCDPFTLAKCNQDDPTLAKTYPNRTHWKVNGKWCSITFDFGRAGFLHTHVSSTTFDSVGLWWHACVCK